MEEEMRYKLDRSPVSQRDDVEKPDSHLWTLAGSWSTRGEPVQAEGDHATSTQTAPNDQEIWTDDLLFGELLSITSSCLLNSVQMYLGNLCSNIRPKPPVIKYNLWAALGDGGKEELQQSQAQGGAASAAIECKCGKETRRKQTTNEQEKTQTSCMWHGNASGVKSL